MKEYGRCIVLDGCKPLKQMCTAHVPKCRTPQKAGLKRGPLLPQMRLYSPATRLRATTALLFGVARRSATMSFALMDFISQ
jgi:hypothetical protein